jgi:hypothetical protein
VTTASAVAGASTTRTFALGVAVEVAAGLSVVVDDQQEYRDIQPCRQAAPAAVTMYYLELAIQEVLEESLHLGC